MNLHLIEVYKAPSEFMYNNLKNSIKILEGKIELHKLFFVATQDDATHLLILPETREFRWYRKDIVTVSIPEPNAMHQAMPTFFKTYGLKKLKDEK